MSEAFLKVVNMSISASWLVLAVLALRLILKKAPKWVNVLLWGIVAIRLICPFSIESALSLIPSAETISPEIMMDWTPEISTGIEPLDQVVNPVISTSFAPEPSASANPLQILIPVSANLWLLGVIIMLAYTAISYLTLRRKLRTAVILRGNIFQCETVSSPFVLGILKPRIYLPYTMDGKNLDHVVAHEQAHIHRKDHWWKPLGFLLLTVYWFNPLMWVAYIMLCRDIELACDEKVIAELGNEQRADYTQALVSCAVNRRMIAACPLAFGEVGVKDRVKSIMNYRQPTFWIVITALIVCAVVAVCFLTNPKRSTIYDIYEQDGYTVIDQEEVDVNLYVDKNKLPDSIYTAEGYEFDENEVVVYSTETTKVYLYKAMISNESDDLLYFIFDFSYDFPKSGSIISPYKHIDDQDGMQSNLYLKSKDLRDVNTTYPEALNIRGYGPGTQFAFYVSKEACQAANGTLIIDIVCNQIVYAKEGHGYEYQHGSSSHVTKWFDYTEDPSQMSYEEELRIQLEEFPDITFKYTPYDIIATTSWEDSDLVGRTILISGLPIWNAYFCDLTGDGLPEICSQVSYGSGIIDNRVIIIDYANGINYKLEDRGYHDYYLRMNDADGYLYVDKRAYNSDELVSSGMLVFKDGCIQIEGASNSPVEITPEIDTIVISHESNNDVESAVTITDNNVISYILSQYESLQVEDYGRPLSEERMVLSFYDDNEYKQRWIISYYEADDEFVTCGDAFGLGNRRVTSEFDYNGLLDLFENASIKMIPTNTDLLGCPAGALLVPIDGNVYRYELTEWDPQGLTVDELLYTFTEETYIEGIVWEVYSLKEYPDKTAVLMLSGTNSAWLCRYSPPARCSEYALNQAMAAGYVVMEDGIGTSGQGIWSEFYDSVQQGKAASVTVVHYFTLDPERCDSAYYEVYSQDYPCLYEFHLEFDGKKFTLTEPDGNDVRIRTFEYLMKYDNTEFYSQSSKTPGRRFDYVLTHDNSVTWEQLWNGLVSSQTGAYIDHYSIYTERTE